MSKDMKDITPSAIAIRVSISFNLDILPLFITFYITRAYNTV